MFKRNLTLDLKKNDGSAMALMGFRINMIQIKKKRNKKQFKEFNDLKTSGQP